MSTIFMLPALSCEYFDLQYELSQDDDYIKTYMNGDGNQLLTQKVYGYYIILKKKQNLTL